MQQENAYAEIQSILNYTNHDLDVVTPFTEMHIPFTKPYARANPIDRKIVGKALGVPVAIHDKHEFKGLNIERLDDHVLYVTSSVFAKLANKWNIVSPDTSPGMHERNEYGSIKSTMGFIAYARRVA